MTDTGQADSVIEERCRAYSMKLGGKNVHFSSLKELFICLLKLCDLLQSGQ